MRILDLGGPDYARSAPKAQDSEGNEIRGATGKGAGYRRGFRLPPAAPLLAALYAHTSPGAPQRGVALSPAWLSFGLRRTRCGARFLHPPSVLAAAHSCLCSSRAAALHLLQALPAPCRGAARPGHDGWRPRAHRYFGAAKQLPGVRELFEKEAPRTLRRTRHQLYAHINADYYGFRDEEDGLLERVEAAAEQQLRQQARRARPRRGPGTPWKSRCGRDGRRGATSAAAAAAAAGAARPALRGSRRHAEPAAGAEAERRLAERERVGCAPGLVHAACAPSAAQSFCYFLFR